MWMVNPRILCRNHLLGEHKELHMIIGHFRLGRSISGYIKNNCIEPLSVIKRHYVIVAEMERRNYNHKSPMILLQDELDGVSEYLPENERNYRVDAGSSFLDLIGRCDECRTRADDISNNVYI